MLVRIFKNPHNNDCKCKIIKFSDRIWLDENCTTFDAVVQREFIVDVDPASPSPLHEIRMLIPRKVVSPFDRNSTWRRKDYLPNRVYLAGSMDIADSRTNPAGVMWGQMAVDGIRDVMFYESYGENQPPFVRDVNEGKFSILFIPFPVHVARGEKRAVRVEFAIKNFLFDRSSDVEHIFDFNFSYFSKKQFDDYVEWCQEFAPFSVPSESDEIESLMVYQKEEHYPGGFDIFLILPQGDETSNVTGDEERLPQDFDMEGKPTDSKRSKLRWRMRNLDRERFEAGQLNLKCGNEQMLRGEICIRSEGLIKISKDVQAIPQTVDLALAQSREEFAKELLQLQGQITQLAMSHNTTVSTLASTTEFVMKTFREHRAGLVLGIALAILGILIALLK